MHEQDIKYIEEVIDQSMERRRSWFGVRKTSKAESAEMVLLAYAPFMLMEVKRLQRIIGDK